MMPMRFPRARSLLVPLAALIIAATSAASEPVVTETIDYYDVSGADVGDIRGELNRVGPVSVVDGKRYDATVRWHVSWNYQYKQFAASCAIATASTAVKATISFPRLKTDMSTPSELKQAFANFADKLMLHEKGHVQTAIDIAKRIEDSIRALPPERTCPGLGEFANNLGRALIKEANQMDLDYDRRTQHGRTQGVKFP
jgi:predicted secreted Zn-dependent protease